MSCPLFDWSMIDPITVDQLITCLLDGASLQFILGTFLYAVLPALAVFWTLRGMVSLVFSILTRGVFGAFGRNT